MWQPTVRSSLIPIKTTYMNNPRPTAKHAKLICILGIATPRSKGRFYYIGLSITILNKINVL